MVRNSDPRVLLRSGGPPRLRDMPALHHKDLFSPTKLALVSLLFLATGCHGEATKTEIPKPRKNAKVESFSEATPVRGLVATDSYLFIATGEGLERWDLASGELLMMSKVHGLPGKLIYSMTYDRERDWLWIATDGGLTSYEVSTSSFSDLPAAPKVLKMGGLKSSVLAPALDGGVWIGTEAGLFYAQGGGRWTNTGVSDPVRSIYQSPTGTLWIGTDKGLLSVNNFRAAVPRDSETGCDFSSVRRIEKYSDEAVVVLANNEAGEERIALVSDEECATYGSTTDHAWSDLVAHGNGGYLISADAMFKMNSEAKTEEELTPPEPSSESLNLKQLSRSDVSHFPKRISLAKVDVPLPKRAIYVASNDRGLYLSTRMTGTMEWKGSASTPRWFRQSRIVGNAKHMTVACETRKSCYIAHGTDSIWHWTGRRFVELDGERTLHALIRTRNGKIVGVRDREGFSEEEAGDLVISTLEKGQWQDLEGISVDTPGRKAYATSLRESPDGTLWFALGYDDDSGSRVGYGVATVNLGLNIVSYHRASFDESVKKSGVIAIPVDVTGIGFVGSDDIWLASTQGASRIIDGKVEGFNEGNGLRSELLYEVVCSSGGMVYSASGMGVGAWDGERWRFPDVLKTSVRDLAFGEYGRLWFATSQGLGVYDGEKARRLSTRHGLIDNDSMELEGDRFGRVWVRTEHGISLVTP